MIEIADAELNADNEFERIGFRQHRIIIAYKQKAPSPKAECVEKHSIFIARVH